MFVMICSDKKENNDTGVSRPLFTSMVSYLIFQ